MFFNRDYNKALTGWNDGKVSVADVNTVDRQEKYAWYTQPVVD